MICDIYKNNFLKNFQKSSEGRESNIHVTELVFNCLRKMVLIQKFKEMEVKRHIDFRNANVIWLGQKYHEVQISNVYLKDGEFKKIENFDDIEIKPVKFMQEYEQYDKEGNYLGNYKAMRRRYDIFDKEGNYLGIYGFEFPIRFKDIVGSIDDIVMMDNELVIVDKKTASKLPDYIYPHYKKQLEYYGVILNEMYPKVNVDKGCILYIRNFIKTSVDLKPVYTEIDIDKSKDEFINKVNMIKEYIKENKIPKSMPDNWDCKFCPYSKLCKKLGDNEIEWSDDMILI